MDHLHGISDDEHSSIEAELIEAFKTELIGPLGGTDFIIDEQRFKLVRDELYLYYPDDLQLELPYILIGFLRFGAPTTKDIVDLGGVVLFLNIRDHPYDDPVENPDDWRTANETAQFKEKAVSKISDRQACAIRRWLEAVRDSDVFPSGSVDADHLRYAIEYWHERCPEPTRPNKQPSGDATE